MWKITDPENKFIDASYILNVLQRDRNLIHEPFFVLSIWRKYGIRKRRSLHPLQRIRHAPRSIKNVQNFMIRLENRRYLCEGFEKRASGVIFCGRESILKTTDAHRRKFILPFCNFCNLIQLCQTWRIYRWGNNTFKLTLVIIYSGALDLSIWLSSCPQKSSQSCGVPSNLWSRAWAFLPSC